jgi:RNA polymerase sigma factor (sigma-70 family)
MKPKQANIDETKLLADLRKGEPRAVQEWFNHYHDRLLNSVLARVSNRNDAEEIVQETFLNCLKHLPLYRAEASIWTWMNSIARHEIADYYRKRYARKAIQTLPLHEWLLAKNIHDSHEISEQVVFVLNKMKKKYSDLLRDKYIEGKKVAVIAAEKGRTVKAIESDLFRAREEFRVLWAAEYGEWL